MAGGASRSMYGDEARVRPFRKCPMCMKKPCGVRPWRRGLGGTPGGCYPQMPARQAAMGVMELDSTTREPLVVCRGGYVCRWMWVDRHCGLRFWSTPSHHDTSSLLRATGGRVPMFPCRRGRRRSRALRRDERARRGLLRRAGLSLRRYVRVRRTGMRGRRGAREFMLLAPGVHRGWPVRPFAVQRLVLRGRLLLYELVPERHLPVDLQLGLAAWGSGRDPHQMTRR